MRSAHQRQVVLGVGAPSRAGRRVAFLDENVTFVQPRVDQLHLDPRDLERAEFGLSSRRYRPTVPRKLRSAVSNCPGL